MRLKDLPEPYLRRVNDTGDVSAWLPPLCDDPRKAPWIAWNVEQDAWFGAIELRKVEAAIDAAPVGLRGPELLVHISAKLRAVRRILPAEQTYLPAMGVNHIAFLKYTRRYDLAPDSHWDDPGMPEEVRNAYANGDSLATGASLRLLPRDTGLNTWLTFDAKGKSVPRDADAVLCQLGLP